MNHLNQPPIYVPRWMLTLKWFMLALVGFAGILAGIPTFRMIPSWEGYTAVWSVGLFVSAGLAGACSMNVRFSTAEKWFGLLAVALLWGYTSGTLITAGWDFGRLASVVIMLTVTMVPTARVGYLITLSGRRREE